MRHRRRRRPTAERREHLSRGGTAASAGGIPPLPPPRAARSPASPGTARPHRPSHASTAWGRRRGTATALPRSLSARSGTPRRRVSRTPQHRLPEPPAFPARAALPPRPALTGPTIAVATVDAPVAMARPSPAHAWRRGRVGAEGPSKKEAAPGDRGAPPPRAGPARKSRKGRSATHCGTRRRGCRGPQAWPGSFCPVPPPVPTTERPRPASVAVRFLLN